MEQNGVTIGFREIFDEVKGMGQVLQRLEQRMTHMEEKTDVAVTADQRSQEALAQAKEATELAKRAMEVVQETEEDRKNNRKWIIGLTVTVASPWLFQLIAALNKFLNGGF
ncbi:hypothetical protein LC040_12060 [Bacillus tianshenii]|nr:hypothetical protein LC040_12060 [Bacillus tianshenii]